MANSVAEGITCISAQRLRMLRPSDAESMSRVLKALADPARLQIVTMLNDADESGICVCDLIKPLSLTQPTVSHHLKVLATSGLVKRSKQGTWVYYSLNRPALQALLAQLPQ